jgi:hypothetical protein
MSKQVDGTPRCFGSFVRMRSLPAIFLDVPDAERSNSYEHELHRVHSQEAATRQVELAKSKCRSRDLNPDGE